MSHIKTILLFGAGKSSAHLIDYLATYTDAQNGKFIICDLSTVHLQSVAHNHPTVFLETIDLNNIAKLKELVAAASAVISMLPVSFHLQIAKLCLQYNKSFFTASFVSDAMRELDAEAKDKGLLLMNEMGVDPGIDHMSGMRLISEVKALGGVVKSFRSYTGGLVEDAADNIWKYKITWNPRNIVLAGLGTAKYIENGQYYYVSYPRIFNSTYAINIEGVGEFEGYPNRNSLQYRQLYQLDDVPTLLRGTLRKKGFCEAWFVLAFLGLTDDTYELELKPNCTYADFLNAFLIPGPQAPEAKVAAMFGNLGQEIIEKLRFLKLFENEVLDRKPNQTPAQILEKIIVDAWKLEPQDHDLLVMYHELEYEINDVHKTAKSYLAVTGESQQYTAMSKTVGLPLAIVVKLYLEGNINLTGVQIPNMAEVYEPILTELEELGVKFTESLD